MSGSWSSTPGKAGCCSRPGKGRQHGILPELQESVCAVGAGQGGVRRWAESTVMTRVGLRIYPGRGGG